MLLIKNYKKIISIISIFCLMLIYSVVPIVEAASLENASDTLSDSDVSASATHTVTYTTNLDLSAGEYIDVTLPSDFGNITAEANITCPANSTRSLPAPVGKIARCTVDASQTLTAGSYTTTIRLYNY